MIKILFAILITCVSLFAQAVPSGNEIIQKLQDQMRFKSDFQAHVKLTQQKPGQGTKVIEMEYFRRDKDDSFLIQMLAPESDRGNGYLRTGENMWMYRRNTRTFQHINRDESIGGSDAKADDFESRNLTEIYAPAKAAQAELLGKIPAYKLEVKGLVNDVDYPKKIWWVSRDQLLLLKEEAYSQGGSLMQTAYYLKYTQVSGRFVPIQQLFIDEFEKGNRTVVEISEIRTGALPESIFTKAHLESLSK